MKVFRFRSDHRRRYCRDAEGVFAHLTRVPVVSSLAETSIHIIIVIIIVIVVIIKQCSSCRSERGGAKFGRRTEFRWWAWRVINISGGKRRLGRSKKLNEWHHLAKVVPSRLAGVCKIVSGDITSSYPLYLGYPTTNRCFQCSRGTTLALEEKQRFLTSRGVGGKERKGKGKEGVRREDVKRRRKERPQFRRTIVLLRRKRRKEEFLPRSKLTAALDTAIPSSQFGILRSHSNKMVRDNGAL